MARLRRTAGGAPLPSGPTAAGLLSAERLGRWRREAGAEAAALAAAARATSAAVASSAEAQARRRRRLDLPYCRMPTLPRLPGCQAARSVAAARPDRVAGGATPAEAQAGRGCLLCLGWSSDTGRLRGKQQALSPVWQAIAPAVRDAQELAALWSSADEAPATCRAMREAAAAIESIFVEAPGRVGAAAGPACAPDPRDSVENWELDAPGGARADEAETLQVCAAQHHLQLRLACLPDEVWEPAATGTLLCAAQGPQKARRRAPVIVVRYTAILQGLAQRLLADALHRSPACAHVLPRAGASVRPGARARARSAPTGPARRAACRAAGYALQGWRLHHRGGPPVHPRGGRRGGCGGAGRPAPSAPGPGDGPGPGPKCGRRGAGRGAARAGGAAAARGGVPGRAAAQAAALAGRAHRCGRPPARECRAVDLASTAPTAVVRSPPDELLASKRLLAGRSSVCARRAAGRGAPVRLSSHAASAAAKRAMSRAAQHS